MIRTRHMEAGTWCRSRIGVTKFGTSLENIDGGKKRDFRKLPTMTFEKPDSGFFPTPMVQERRFGRPGGPETQSHINRFSRPTGKK